MRTEKSPLKWMLRRYAYLGAVTLALVFLIGPVLGTIALNDTLNNLRWANQPMSAGVIERFRREVTLLKAPEFCCAVLGGLGFLSALCLFGHLHSRRQSQLIAALPVKREKDFLLRAAAFAFLCLIPTALCLLCYPVVIAARQPAPLYFRWGLFLAQAGVALLIECYGFAAGALAASLTGTVWAACLAGLTLIGSGEMMFMLWDDLLCWYLRTRVSALNAGKWFSPVYTLYKGFYDPLQFRALPGPAAILLMLGLALWCYRRRRVENTGRTLTFAAADIPLTAWFTVLGGALGAYAFALITRRQAGLFLGAAGGAAAAALAARAVFDQNIRAVLRRWAVPAVCGAALIAVLFGLRADVLGFDSRMPDLTGLTAVTYRNAMNDDTVTLTGEETARAAAEWAELWREASVKDRASHPLFMNDMHEMTFTFEAGGRKITRGYFRRPDAALAEPYLKTVIESEEYKASKMPAGAVKDLYASALLYNFYMPEETRRELFGVDTNRDLNIYKLDPAEVTRALEKDIPARTLEDYRGPQFLSLSGTVENESDGYPMYCSVPIYPCDKNTIRLVLGDKAQAWTEYASLMPLADHGEFELFVCEYGNRGQPVNWEHLTLASQKKEWLARAYYGNSAYYAPPLLEGKYLAVYNMSEAEKYPGVNLNDLDSLPLQAFELGVPHTSLSLRADK